jgi:hypothetical protein
MKRLYFILLLFLALVIRSQAQLFTEVTTATFPGLYIGSCSWGNYNNDGFLDIYLTGYGTSSSRVSKVFKNNGNSTFTDIGAAISQIGNSAGEWGDYNNDNIIDLVQGGNITSTPSVTGHSRIYSNTGPGTFAENTLAGLPDMVAPEISWGDYDNDGDMDLAYGGQDNSSFAYCKLFRNDGGGLFTPVLLFDSISDGAVAFGDYDNDGYLDLLLAGRIGSFDYITRLYHNNGNGTFSNSAQSFTGLRTSSVAWGDYDQDGDLDILVTGSDNNDVLHTIIYKNNNGIFADIYAPITPVRYGKAAWGDYDNDGDLDFLLIGQINSTGSAMTTTVYQNTGGDTFTEVTGLGIDGLRRSFCAWGDYDNDGRLDFLIMGRTSGGTYTTKLYKNNTTVYNTPPTAPSGLTSIRIGDNITFSWNASTDTQTASAGLTYNLRIGTTPGGSQICSAMANPVSGYRNIAQIGNMNSRRTFTIKNLPEGTYYWSVQAIDNAFAGSTFATEQSFSIVNNKTLNVHFFIQGLYNGATMNKAQDENGDYFSGTIADRVSIDLHSSTAPYGLVDTLNNIDLNTNGTSTTLVPSTHNGSYYLAVRHRNSMETWSANPVSFSGSAITYIFDNTAKAYGDNMALMAGGNPGMFAGDTNQDGIIDGGDLSAVGNQADFAVSGYIPEDVNGDGLVDGTDLSLTGNNADAAIGIMTP